MNSDHDITWIADSILDGLIMPSEVDFDEAKGECLLLIWLLDKEESQRIDKRLGSTTNFWRRHDLRLRNVSSVNLKMQTDESPDRYFTCSRLHMRPEYIELATHDGFVFVAELRGIPMLTFTVTNECILLTGY